MPYKGFLTNIDETAGLKHYCTCDESANKPCCDSSHNRKNTGKLPKEVFIENGRMASICACGETGISSCVMALILSSDFCQGTEAFIGRTFDSLTLSIKRFFNLC